MTDTRDDEKVAALIDRLGWAGYGLWWGVLEIIAKSMLKDATKCAVHYPVSKWAAALQLHPPNVRRTLADLCATGLLTMICDDAGIELSWPNLLKYRDEYSQKSRHSPDNVRSKLQRQNTETETEQLHAPEAGAVLIPSGNGNGNGNGHKRKPTRTTEEVLEKMHPTRRQMFLELWAILPIGSKIRAAERFGETPLKNGDWPKVIAGAKFYVSEVDEIRRQRPSFKGQHLQGWLTDRRWEQYENKPANSPGLIPEWKGYA